MKPSRRRFLKLASAAALLPVFGLFVHQWFFTKGNVIQVLDSIFCLSFNGHLNKTKSLATARIAICDKLC